MVIETTNYECPYVRKHYSAKNMQTQQREAAAKGVVWLTSASSATGEQGYVTAQQANDLTKSRDAAPAAVLLDPQSKIARAYGATVTPHMYIIDANGILVYKGGIDSDSVGRHRRHPQGQAVCARRPRGTAGGQAGDRLLDPALRLLAEIPAHLEPELPAMPHDGWHPHEHEDERPTRRFVLAAATFLPFGGANAQTVEAASAHRRISQSLARFASTTGSVGRW